MTEDITQRNGPTSKEVCVLKTSYEYKWIAKQCKGLRRYANNDNHYTHVYKPTISRLMHIEMTHKYLTR
jgi:hypothetical protein